MPPMRGQTTRAFCVAAAVSSAGVLLWWLVSLRTTDPEDLANPSAPAIQATDQELRSPAPDETADRLGPVDEDNVELGPGLLARYRSLSADQTAAELLRIDPKPAFTFGESSPHPRLPAGPFAIDWTGVLLLREPGPIRFSAFVAGELRIVVGDVVVLEGRGESTSSWIEGSESFAQPPGAYHVAIHFRSVPDVPARVQVWWDGPSFAREPLPAARLKHIRSELPPSFERELLVAKGRDDAELYGC